jgi:hypothetical protein
MKVGYSRFLLWLAYLDIAFFLYLAARAAYLAYVENRSGWLVIGEVGLYPIVAGLALFFASLRALLHPRAVLIELGDEALGYVDKKRQWISLPYRAMRVARVASHSYKLRGMHELYITMENGDTYMIQLNSIDTQPGEIFAELRRHLPNLVQPDPNDPRLVPAGSA